MTTKSQQEALDNGWVMTTEQAQEFIEPEMALGNFDYNSLKIKPLDSVPDKHNVIIEFGYSVCILWSCGQHDHHWRFMAQLCHYFNKLKRR